MLIHLKRLLALILLIFSATSAHAGPIVDTGHVRAELVAYAPEGLAPGKTVWLGLRMAHAPGWHSYWKNPGDSGLPTELAWKLPKGARAGDIDWPAPGRIPLPPLMNFGYSGTVLLPVPVTLSDDYSGGPIAASLTANWLVCESQCIPETGEFSLVVPVVPSIAEKAAFEAAWGARPVQVAGVSGRFEVAGANLRVRIDNLPEGLSGKDVAFLPETPALIENAATVAGSWSGTSWTGEIPMLKSPDPIGNSVPVVLEIAGGNPAAVRAVLTKGAVSAAAPARSGSTFAWALIGALIGGMILNLMPCVFPILSLKVFGIARHGGDRRELARTGGAYALGVILSFVALAGVLLALRAGGEQLGWGFQLQSPGFVAFLAVLFFLIALNLIGAFEVGSFLPSRVASLRARNPTADSFLTGVLAVAVASPCTAPFMGASIGLAATLPAAQALLLFAVLGVGMALPLLIFSLVPAVARAMPRPGAWMETFRHCMAFPMFATVVWLLWVVAQSAGPDALAILMFAMVALGFAIWLWQVGGTREPWRSILRIAAILLVAGMAFEVGHALTSPAQVSVASGAEWKPWSEAEVSSLTKAGKPVFVDFTASWCVTCQFNKRVVLSEPAVVAAMDKCGVQRLEADWTRRDPAITGALARFGRNGVPVYALYGGGETVLLNEVLSKGEVLGALAKLPGCGVGSGGGDPSLKS
ncbi:thioredoxin family protein [soil metagenome]